MKSQKEIRAYFAGAQWTKKEMQQALHRPILHDAYQQKVIERLKSYTKRTVKEKLKDWCIDSIAQLFMKIGWAKQLYLDLEFYMYINKKGR